MHLSLPSMFSPCVKFSRKAYSRKILLHDNIRYQCHAHIPVRANFTLVSEIHQLCVHRVWHTPNACGYIAVILPNLTPTTPTDFSIAQSRRIPTYNLYKQCIYKMSDSLYVYASSSFSHPHWPYITLLLLYILLLVVAVLLLVDVICASMKFIDQQLQPSLFSRGYSVVILFWGMWTHHHFLPSTSPFSTWNVLALIRSLKGVAVHKLLLHSKCLWCGFEDPLGLSSPNYSDTALRCEAREALASHFYPLTTSRIVKVLVGGNPQ